MPRSSPLPDDSPDGAPAPAGYFARLGGVFSSPLGRWLRGALVAAFAVLALSLVLRQARAAVYRMPAYRVGPASVRFLDLPTSVDERMRTQLTAWLPRLFPSDPARWPSLYETGIEGRLREALGAHPMLRAVKDLEVRYPAQVLVRAEVRTPLARFQARVGAHADGRPLLAQVPLDRDGVVLDPDTYAPFLASHRTVLVTGVEAQCPAVGRRWTDTKDQVAEGLEAARTVNRLNEDLAAVGPLRVESVDVSGFPAPLRARDRGEVVLRLSDGRTVQWGRTERAAGDVTREDGYDAKRDRLLDALAVRGAAPVVALDVRFPVNSRRPVGR